MKLLALDGNSIINRAFYGIRRLDAPDGTPTNGIYGFLTILQKLIGEESPDAVAVTFDLPAPTFRHELYAEYKAHRKGMPDELKIQMPILKQVLDAMCVTRYELSGWEADDLLGAIAKKCEDENWQCVIVTGDKDSLQLVTERTRVRHVKTRAGQTETKNYTVDSFTEEYGFPPRRLIDLKALMGDTSDNIPGVPGVGEKTALDLVARFGGIGDIYSGLDSLDIKDSVRKKLLAGQQNAELSYELAEIRFDAPLEFSLSDTLCREPDSVQLYELFRQLGFNRFIEKLGLKASDDAVSAAPVHESVEVTTAGEVAALLIKLKESECVSIRVGDGFYALAAAVHGESTVYILRQSATEDYDTALQTILSGAVKKAGHDVKDTIRLCLEHGYSSEGWIFDTALAAYLISPTDSSYDLARLSGRYLGLTLKSAAEENGQMTLLSGSDDCAILSDETNAVSLLRETLLSKLSELCLDDLFFNIEMPLCHVLAEMEQFGFLVDRPALIEFGKALAKGISETEKLIYELAGETFNINSPKQLGVILFEKLMLPAPKRTKTGYSTNIEVLQNLKERHPIIGHIIEFRELSKLKSTYADGLQKVIGADGRIHTRFQMTVTATGRLSSVEPNLQNIPIRKEMGSELRKMFVAGEGNVLVDADYSQIELRLLAHIAQDEVMRSAFINDEDIHTVTASQVFGVPVSEVTALMRSRAKAVNFGIVYGISAFSLAQDIGVSAREAKAYIDSYLEKYAGVRGYMSNIVESAKKDGFVATLYGRRRDLPELKAQNHNTRSFGERVALNMPIQGTAADIIKLAMIRVSHRLKSEKLAARLILQIHDELIVECPESEAAAVCAVLREEMENAAHLSVKLIAETHMGKNWSDAK